MGTHRKADHNCTLFIQWILMQYVFRENYIVRPLATPIQYFFQLQGL